MERKSWGHRNEATEERPKEKQECDALEEIRHNQYLLHKVVGRLNWMEWHCHPPVNYPLIAIVSIVTSVITTVVISQL